MPYLGAGNEYSFFFIVQKEGGALDTHQAGSLAHHDMEDFIQFIGLGDDGDGSGQGLGFLGPAFQRLKILYPGESLAQYSRHLLQDSNILFGKSPCSSAVDRQRPVRKRNIEHRAHGMAEIPREKFPLVIDILCFEIRSIYRPTFPPELVDEAAPPGLVRVYPLALLGQAVQEHSRRIAVRIHDVDADALEGDLQLRQSLFHPFQDRLDISRTLHLPHFFPHLGYDPLARNLCCIPFPHAPAQCFQFLDELRPGPVLVAHNPSLEFRLRHRE